MQLSKRGLHEALRASKGRRNTGNKDKVVVHMEDGKQLEWHFRRYCRKQAYYVTVKGGVHDTRFL